MSDLSEAFEAALERLRQWYGDSLKATSYDGDKTSHSKPGAIELRWQDYPHERYWRNRWSLAKGDVGRREVVEELRREYRDLAVSPSKKYLFRWWDDDKKRAIAAEEGPSAKVARLWGVAPSTVRKYRKLHRSKTS